jgi:hypothetical protein
MRNYDGNDERVAVVYDGEFLGYLMPIYDNRASFYKKAKVFVFNGCLYLQSYATIVAKVGGNCATVWGWYSQTTMRHINEFLRQNGFETMTKKDLKGTTILEK